MWIWNGSRRKAAVLVAADQITDKEIAERCGVSRRTLQVWKVAPEFVAQVEHHLLPWRERALSDGVADRDRRLHRTNDLWRRLLTVVDEQARYWKDWQAQKKGRKVPPGAFTGLLDKFGARDNTLTKEIRAMMVHAARETGQWDEKAKPTNRQIIIVVPRAIAPTTKPMIELLPEPPPLELPGVTADLR